jgi:hypothetical protein
MMMRTFLLLGTLYAICAAAFASVAAAAALDATPQPPPNLVVISDRLVTTGQSSAAD